MTKSSIEWTNETWNPVTGCSKVSPGCAHCYAERVTQRFNPHALPWTPANAAENVTLHEDRLDAPLHWRRPRMVFVNSMSDLFHEQVPDDFIDRVFAVMSLTAQHTYQILTKRPERMLEYMAYSEIGRAGFVEGRAKHIARRVGIDLSGKTLASSWPLANVWLGVSVENQRWADERIPLLLQTPSAVRFISAEPLLGPVTLRNGMGNTRDYLDNIDFELLQPWPKDALGLDWVIVGGESGPCARPMDLAWARALRDECASTKPRFDGGVAFFMKQLGGMRPGSALEDLPEDLRIREWPR